MIDHILVFAAAKALGGAVVVPLCYRVLLPAFWSLLYRGKGGYAAYLSDRAELDAQLALKRALPLWPKLRWWWADRFPALVVYATLPPLLIFAPIVLLHELGIW